MMRSVRNWPKAHTVWYASVACACLLFSAAPVYSQVRTQSYSFEYNPNGNCARVVVQKRSIHPRTVIVARGYNTSCAAIATNPRALERAVEIRY